MIKRMGLLSPLTVSLCILFVSVDGSKDTSEVLNGERPEILSEFFTENEITANGEGDRCKGHVLKFREKIAENGGPTTGVKSTVGLGSALIIFVLVGTLAAGIAHAFQMVRKHVYHDADNLDTAFDAGGKVSVGLTATTIVSQWTWSATLLQSSTVASKYGISGPYWYAGGATIQIILFAVLSIMLKMRAPGAKTFLQVIKARFGSRTHLVFCVFAFFTNLIIMMSLTIAGTAVLNSLVKGLSPELAAMLLATVIGGYTLIGGLGATFYVSYFNTAIIFILILMLIIEVFSNPSGNPDNPFGSSASIFDFIACWRAPEGNRENSYLTFYSSGGFVFGMVNIIGNFGTVFCDQAYWQSSVAAKPLQGVWGFILGGLTWFAIPFSLATTMGLAYIGLSSAQGSPMLTNKEISAGLTAPLVAQKLLGPTGEYAMLFLILMAVMSTGSAEVIAVASIIIYDIYQVYIQPFRRDRKTGHCIICGKPTKPGFAEHSYSQLCTCPSASSCQGCKEDSDIRSAHTGLVKPHFACIVHKDYKEYQEQLLGYKNWCIVLCTFMSIPLCLFCWAVNLDLAWTYYFTGILIASSVVPISLSILWARATSQGMITGVVGGCLFGVTVWLSYAAQFEGGLAPSAFVKNTGQEYPMLAGNIAAILMGASLAIMVSLLTRRPMSQAEIEAEWEKTRDIDNPLSPWVQVYKNDLDFAEGETFHDRPPLDLVIKKYRPAKITAFAASVFFTAFFIGVLPGSMLSVDVVGLYGFTVWTTLSQGWAYVAAIFIIVVPLLQEILAIKSKISAKVRNRESDNSSRNEMISPLISSKNMSTHGYGTDN